jgi:transposase
MTISEFTLKSNEREPVRRLEVFTGSGRRRDWSEEDKARIVSESYETDETVSGVARRHALSPQQLFAWRRAARRSETIAPASVAPAFVPAAVGPPSGSAAKRPSSGRARKADREAGIIELEIDGVAMRVGRGADTKTVSAVLRALKGIL